MSYKEGLPFHATAAILGIYTQIVPDQILNFQHLQHLQHLLNFSQPTLRITIFYLN